MTRAHAILAFIFGLLVLIAQAPFNDMGSSSQMHVGATIIRSKPCPVALAAPSMASDGTSHLLPAGTIDTYCPDNIPPQVSTYYQEDENKEPSLVIRLVY